MSGPARKPTALRILEGKNDKPSDHRGLEPVPTAAPLLKPPADLKGEALAEWGRIVPELKRLGLVTVLDRAYLVAYCESWAMFDAARESLSEHGPLIEGQKGNLVRNPAAQIVREAADSMIKFGSRFGLSPADRARLEVGNESDATGGLSAEALALIG